MANRIWLSGYVECTLLPNFDLVETFIQVGVHNSKDEAELAAARVCSLKRPDGLFRTGAFRRIDCTTTRRPTRKAFLAIAMFAKTVSQ